MDQIIRLITKQDVPKVVRTMADSFQQEDLYTYFLPDEGQRAAFLEKFMLFRLKFGMKYGTVLVTDDCQGVAVFLPPENKMKPKDLLLLGGASAMMSCDKEARQRIMNFNNYADEACAACIQAPHWHISPICVSPAFQGKGYGSALMAYGNEHVITPGTPCFLETQSAKNEGFYIKFGFVKQSSTTVPNSTLPHITMVRPG